MAKASCTGRAKPQPLLTSFQPQAKPSSLLQPPFPCIQNCHLPTHQSVSLLRNWCTSFSFWHLFCWFFFALSSLPSSRSSRAGHRTIHKLAASSPLTAIRQRRGPRGSHSHISQQEPPGQPCRELRRWMAALLPAPSILMGT